MSLFICALNSGSNGNCYYIANDIEAVLIDTGLTCRETEKRMRRLGLTMDKVKAIFISHEHGDHIKGLEVISSKYNLPVYISENTLQHSRLRLNPSLIISLKAYQPVCIGNLLVHTFPKQHDAADPHSFIITGNGINIGVFTDIGAPCQHVINHFKQCHAAFLEANYDDDMLERGRYPYHLKKRIKSNVGHLSNQQALELFTNHKPSFMTHLLLSHLSKDNNCPNLVHNFFSPHAGNTEIIVASRYQETDVYKINGSVAMQTPARKPVSIQQISLF